MKNTKFIEQEIFKDINTRLSALEEDNRRLDVNLKSVVIGVQQTHSSLIADMTRLLIRINFMIQLMKEKYDATELEARFDEFEKAERKRMQEDLAKAVEAMENSNKETKSDVLQ